MPVKVKPIMDIAENRPIGETFEPGSKVTKFWTLINSGETSWPEGCIIVLEKGQSDFEPITLPELPAGMEYELTINFTVEETEGKHKNTWRV